MKDLIFKEFLPASFEKQVTVIKADQQNSTFPYRPTYDLFGDGSILVASVDGHAKGQACLYFPDYNLFIAADLWLGCRFATLYETNAPHSVLGSG